MTTKDKVKYARESVALALEVVLELCDGEGHGDSEERILTILDFCKDTIKEINEKERVSE